MARSKRGTDGNYEIPNERTKLVAEKMNDWRQKETEGTWAPNRHDDVLNRALEKREHPGRVRGVGGTVSIKDIFGEGEKRKGPRGVISADQLHLISQDIEAKLRQEIEAKVSHEMEEKMNKKVEAMEDKMNQKFAHILNMMGQQMPIAMEANNIQSPGIRSSCQSVHPTKTKEKDSFVELQKPTKCRLALNLESKIIVVGRGMVHPASRPGDQCHNQQILADHVKVGIDAVESSHQGTPLPVPTNYLSTIGEAVGSFVQWHKSLVLLREMDTDKGTHEPSDHCLGSEHVAISKKKLSTSNQMLCVKNQGSISQPNKSVIGSNTENVMNTMPNESPKSNTIVDEGILETLMEDCRYLHDLIVKGPFDDNVINKIQVNKDLFKYDNDFEINITNDDIVQFLSMTWLNASWLQIYIIWLNHMCNDLKVETIGFMCPHQLSQVRKSPDATNLYMSNTWRLSKSKSLLLAPYYEEKQCLLLVFIVQKNEVYVFDPRGESKRNNLEIRAQANAAFKLCQPYGCKSRGASLKWKNVKCPQQSKSMDCVYYVMRYMYEIVTNHHQSVDFQKDFKQGGSYSQQEMDEIRVHLAKYILEN